MDSKIEHIIKNYQYFELDESQKNLISDWAENSDEFEALQNTLLATDKFVKSLEEGLNPTIKQRLDVRFAEKYNKSRLVWYNKLWFFLWPNESPFYKRPLIQFAAICLVVALTIPFFPDFKQPQLAMNDIKTEEKVEDKNKSNTIPEEKPMKEIESTDEIAETKREGNIPEVGKLDDSKVEEIDANQQSVISSKEEGWKLNEEQTMAGIESKSQGSANARKDIPSMAEDQEEVSFYDKLDVDAPALKQISANRLEESAGTPKKVEVKETLDLLTALY